ncbi:Uma2 family endonuclease [Calothrix sp. FACHB-1219]|uniref:Uma2 family endonuclease n=1 Tax=unclassified Calothrix TaxID=2619626 RepID=UPI001682FE80|nr:MULTISPECIES: Uma2 family endonuclease [unclassified Calothrix]MBD2206870.1 Uma2 family endonuclease [Calothrix sp. FACHB-168]MBD2219541.1 Uma2 family endonuclease [Calothrix sp. FACHB-1219]
MSVAKDLPIPEDVIFPNSDLLSDEPPLETYLHLQQMLLLLKCLEWWWRDYLHIDDFFAAGNISIYYSQRQRKSEDVRGPDFFIVCNTENRIRNSWIVWEEDGKYPNLIIELLSPTTASVDKGLKKQIYQDIFRTPEYFWFDPKTLEFAGFILLGGTYQPIEPNPQGLLWSQQLSLYLGIHETKLRYFTAEGQVIPTPEEFAQQQQQLAEQEKQRAQQQQQLAEQEKQRAERLATKLRELGIDPDTL